MADKQQGRTGLVLRDQGAGVEGFAPTSPDLLVEPGPQAGKGMWTQGHLDRAGMVVHTQQACTDTCTARHQAAAASELHSYRINKGSKPWC